MSDERTHSGPGSTGATLTGDFKLDTKLALQWLGALIAAPPVDISPDDYVTLLAWRRALLLSGAGMSSGRGGPQRGRMLLQAACRQADVRAPNWWRGSTPTTATSPYAANTEKGDASPSKEQSPSEQFPDELWDAFTAPTNLAGTGLAISMTADALFHSLPLRWQVTMQRGTWELYDENATQRVREYGKAASGRSRVPPRLVLRARGARLEWLTQVGAKVGTNSTRFPATAGAKTLAQALRIAKADTMKLLAKDAYEVLKLRKIVGGNALGLAVTVLPQAYVDARDTGLIANADAAHWKNFVVKEAKSQSANLAGFAAGVIAGASLAVAGVTAAPVVIILGLAAGATAQAGFNAWGLSGAIEDTVRSKLFGK